jgi:predicted TIM-barrel fold metal-dependent hydrolase
MSARVDMHTHFLTSTLADALRRREELPRIIERDGREFVEYAPGVAYPLVAEMIDLDEKLARIDAAGIDFAVLSVNIPGLDHFPAADGPGLARDVNDELVAVVSRYPDRLAALASLPLQTPGPAAEELERAVGIGLKGAMIYSNVAGRPLDEGDFQGVFKAAAELDVPVLLHPTAPLYSRNIESHMLVPVVGFLFDTTVATLRLVYEGLYDRHPDFKLIIGHTGSLIPHLAGRIELEGGRLGAGSALQRPPIDALRRLYTDTISAWPPALRSALDFLGAEQILLGTDAPFWEASATYRALEKLDLDRETAARINGENAVRLFKLAPASA